MLPSKHYNHPTRNELNLRARLSLARVDSTFALRLRQNSTTSLEGHSNPKGPSTYNHILTQNLYCNYYYPNPKYLDPQGNLALNLTHDHLGPYLGFHQKVSIQTSALLLQEAPETPKLAYRTPVCVRDCSLPSRCGSSA